MTPKTTKSSDDPTNRAQMERRFDANKGHTLQSDDLWVLVPKQRKVGTKTLSKTPERGSTAMHLPSRLRFLSLTHFVTSSSILESLRWPLARDRA